MHKGLQELLPEDLIQPTTATPQNRQQAERCPQTISHVGASHQWWNLAQSPPPSPLGSFSNLSNIHIYSIYFLFGPTSICSVTQTLRTGAWKITVLAVFYITTFAFCRNVFMPSTWKQWDIKPKSITLLHTNSSLVDPFVLLFLQKPEG